MFASALKPRSVSDQPQIQVVNPLAAMRQAAETAGSVYDVRQKQANEAAGQLYQQAIDPETGRFDPQRFNALLSQAGPGAALAAQKAVESSTTLAGQNLAQSAFTGKLIGNSITAALQGDDAGLHQRIVDQAKFLLSQGIPADRVLGGLVGLSNDPATMRGQLETMRTSLMPSSEATEQIQGTPFTYTAPGGGLAGGTVSRQTGQLRPSGGAPIPQGLTAAQLDKEFTYTDPVTQKPMTTTYRQWLIDHGFTFPASGGTGGGPGGLPSSLRGPNAPAPAPAAQPGAAPAATPAATPQPGPQPVQTGPSPADLETQKREATQSTDAYQDISNKAVASRDRSAILGNMLGDVPQFTAGPLAPLIGRMRSLGVSFGLKGFDPEAQSAQESFNKLAAQLANAQGAGSDARMNVTMESQPHQTLSQAGATLMIHQLQGNEDYLQARARLATAQPAGKLAKQFETEIGAQLDPRAFQFARMSVPERQNYVKNLSEKDAAVVKKAYNTAVNNGWITPGG